MIFTADNPALPIKLVKIKDYDPSVYWYQHFDDNLSLNLIPGFQSAKCYLQKWTTKDNPVMQILSDYEDFTAKLIDLTTDLVQQEFTIVEVETQILNETFKCYEFEIDFSTIPEGIYQLQVDNGADIYYSDPQLVKEVHPNTILTEYSNSENNFSLILNANGTGPTWTGKFRVEAAILNFKPGSDDVIYNDQKRNSTTLYSVPFRQFQFIMGGLIGGLPDSIVDKVNRIFSFNILSLDGEYYNKLEGAKFEEQRVEGYAYSAQVIDIVPVENGFLQQFNTTGLIPEDEDMIQYQKVIKYLSNSANITIEDKFRAGHLLEKICIINRGINFEFSVTTEGSGYDDFNISETAEGITTTIVINQLFNGIKTLYLVGFDDVDTDVYILYKDLLAKPSGVQNPYGSLGIGAVVIYDADTQEAYDIDWNFSTGLGREGTSWEGWQIYDKLGERFPMGYKFGSSFASNLLTNIGGSFNIILDILNLPKFRLKMFAPTINTVSNDTPGATDKVARAGTNGGGDLNYEMRKSTAEATLGVTSEAGGDEPYEHKQPYLVCLYVKKIAEV